MSFLGVLGNADCPERQLISMAGHRGLLTKCSLCVVDPVRSKEATECCDKYYSTIVFDRLSKFCNLARALEEIQVVLQKLDSRSGNSDTAL